MAHHHSETYDSVFYSNIVNFVISCSVHQHFHIAEDCPGRFQWPRGLRRRLFYLSPSEIMGSNPSGGMDVGLL